MDTVRFVNGLEMLDSLPHSFSGVVEFKAYDNTVVRVYYLGGNIVADEDITSSSELNEYYKALWLS